MMSDENRNRYEAMADADFEGIQVLLGTNEPWRIVGALQFILGSVLQEQREQELRSKGFPIYGLPNVK